VSSPSPVAEEIKKSDKLNGKALKKMKRYEK